MDLTDRFIGVDDLARCIGTTRGAIYAIRRLQKPALKQTRDPASPRKNKVLLNVADVVDWLAWSIQLTGAQRDRIVNRSKVILAGDLGVPQ